MKGNKLIQHGFSLILKIDQDTQLYALEEAILPKGGRIVSSGKSKTGMVGTKRPAGGPLEPVKREIIPPHLTIGRGARRGGEASSRVGNESQADQSSVAGGAAQDEVMANAVDDEGLAPNEETNTKADENEQLHNMQREYAKTAFIIPSCSAWFNIETIHEIEMQSLPEYFCGKFPHKNSATYLDYRNFIIKLYRESPNAYLSATVCRKNLPGDVCSIIRLHAFLELWGLINFNVDPHLRPPKIQLGGSSMNPQLIDIAAKGYLKVQEAEALQRQFQAKGVETENISQGVYLIAARKISVLSSSKRPNCNFCGNLCGTYWFSKKPQMNSFVTKEEQAVKAVGEAESLHQALRGLTQTYVLCRDCFTGGHYPKILSAFDFEK